MLSLIHITILFVYVIEVGPKPNSASSPMQVIRPYIDKAVRSINPISFSSHLLGAFAGRPGLPRVMTKSRYDERKEVRTAECWYQRLSRQRLSGHLPSEVEGWSSWRLEAETLKRWSWQPLERCSLERQVCQWVSWGSISEILDCWRNASNEWSVTNSPKYFYTIMTEEGHPFG